MIHTLLVYEVAPPSPSIWRGSGLPKAASSTRSRSGPAGGKSFSMNIRHLLVPPRISTKRKACCCIQVYFLFSFSRDSRSLYALEPVHSWRPLRQLACPGQLLPSGHFLLING